MAVTKTSEEKQELLNQKPVPILKTLEENDLLKLFSTFILHNNVDKDPESIEFPDFNNLTALKRFHAKIKLKKARVWLSKVQFERSLKNRRI